MRRLEEHYFEEEFDVKYYASSRRTVSKKNLLCVVRSVTIYCASPRNLCASLGASTHIVRRSVCRQTRRQRFIIIHV